MHHPSKIRCASRVLIGALSALALAGAPLRGGPAQAGDDAGVREFIASQAARTVPPEPRAPVVASPPTEPYIQRHFVSPRREAKRTTAVAQQAAVPARRPKVQYVRLSPPEAR